MSMLRELFWQHRGHLLRVYLTVACASCSTPEPASHDAGVATTSTAPGERTSVAPDPGDYPPDASGWGVAAGLRYLEVMRGGATPEQRVPTVVLLHGMGGRAMKDWIDALDVVAGQPARVILPQAQKAAGTGFSWFEYSPDPLRRDEHSAAQGIAAAAQQLARLLAIVQTQRPVTGRFVVSGFSQGGILSYALALRHPESIQHAIAVSGYLPRELWPTTPASERQFPVIDSLHGSTDVVVDFTMDTELVQHLRSLGYRVEFTAFQGVGHEITPEMRGLWRRALASAVPR